MEELTQEELTQEPRQPEAAPQQAPEQPQPNPRRRERREPQKASVQLPDLSGLKLPQLRLPTFLREIGKDVKWYYDVRLWLPVILILVILAACTGARLAQPEETLPPETLAQEAPPTTQATEPPTTQAPIDPEAEALAILADSVGNGRSDNVKTIIMWLAINRSEDYANGHGKSLLEEIARPDQWQGYNPEFDYSQHTYEIALEVLHIRDTGGLRPLDSDMLWLVLNDDGSITVRNMYTATADQKWREKVVK